MDRTAAAGAMDALRRDCRRIGPQARPLPKRRAERRYSLPPRCWIIMKVSKLYSATCVHR